MPYYKKNHYTQQSIVFPISKFVTNSQTYKIIKIFAFPPAVFDIHKIRMTRKGCGGFTIQDSIQYLYYPYFHIASNVQDGWF